MRRRGVSLVEALLSLLVMGLALAAIATVVRLISSVSAFSGGKDLSLQAAQLALVRLRDESLQALEWLAPNSSSVVNEVRFRRLSPAASGRLPVPARPAPPAPWDPMADQILVRWYVDGETLKRAAGSETVEVAQAVPSLEARFLPGGELELSLTVRERQRTVRWKTETALQVGR